MELKFLLSTIFNKPVKLVTTSDSHRIALQCPDIPAPHSRRPWLKFEKAVKYSILILSIADPITVTTRSKVHKFLVQLEHYDKGFEFWLGHGHIHLTKQIVGFTKWNRTERTKIKNQSQESLHLWDVYGPDLHDHWQCAFDCAHGKDKYGIYFLSWDFLV
jgi:hypothetical protein